MEITILGGKDEIGGNKILVEHKGTRIFLDFGMSFKTAGLYYSEFLQPRKVNGLQDFFETGLLPDIPGIYRQDYIEHMGRPKEKRSVDALFLSHAHADHAQYIHFLRRDIPIYCTKSTKLILQALEETGSGGFKDLITVCESYKHYENKKGTLSRVTRAKKEYVYERPFHILGSWLDQDMGKVKIGSLEVEGISVDHSLPGACGFIVNSDEGSLVYTGDIRFHGYRRKLSENFVEKAKSVNPTWLLVEGTRIQKSEIDDEKDVSRKIGQYISKTKSVVFVEYPMRDLDRALSIYYAAKENGRNFAVNLKSAYLIELLGDLSPIRLDDVKIFIPQKGWGLISKEGYDDQQIAHDYSLWEQNLITRDNVIIAQDLVNKPHKYVVSMNMWEINSLLDIKPKDAIWIKSSCEPFTDDMELDEERKKNWLKKFNIKEYYAHASGHASGKEIKKMIKDLNPKHVIPVHTEHSNEFEK